MEIIPVTAAVALRRQSEVYLRLDSSTWTQQLTIPLVRKGLFRELAADVRFYLVTCRITERANCEFTAKGDGYALPPAVMLESALDTAG
jgi:hypothetical protein